MKIDELSREARTVCVTATHENRRRFYRIVRIESRWITRVVLMNGPDSRKSGVLIAACTGEKDDAERDAFRAIRTDMRMILNHRS